MARDKDNEEGDCRARRTRPHALRPVSNVFVAEVLAGLGVEAGAASDGLTAAADVGRPQLPLWPALITPLPLLLCFVLSTRILNGLSRPAVLPVSLPSKEVWDDDVSES